MITENINNEQVYINLKKEVLEKLKFHLQNSKWKLNHNATIIYLDIAGDIDTFNVAVVPAYDDSANPGKNYIDFRCGKHLLLKLTDNGYGNDSPNEFRELHNAILKKLKEERRQEYFKTEVDNLKGLYYAIANL